MARAGFKRVFVGIETPDEESLIECGKVQNTQLTAFLRSLWAIGVWNRDGRDTAATKAAIRRLREGGILAIFIGGRIALPGEEPPPKDGVALSALQTGATVVPAYISGLIYHYHAALSFFARHHVRVRYGPPVDLSDIAGKDREAARQATARIWSAVMKLKEQARAKGERV